MNSRQIHTNLVWLSCLLLAGCQSTEVSTLDHIAERGFIRAGYSEEPPYAFLDTSGVVRGESPTALRQVADSLGISDIRWVRLDFPALIPTLLAGRVDVVAAGMFPTPQRRELVRFSVPTVCPAAALVTDARSAVQSLDQVARDSTLRLAVMQGTVEEAAARVLGIPAERTVQVRDVEAGVAAVLGDVADALAITRPTARLAVSRTAGPVLAVRTYEPPPAVASLLVQCSALAFRDDDENLIEVADAVLRRYIGSTEHLDSLQALGFSRAELP